MTNNTLTPPLVLWAQKRTEVFLTFSIETKDPDIKIEESSVYFKGLNVRDNKEYEVTIPLYDSINPENSTFVNKGRCVEMVLSKKYTGTAFWPSLTSDKKKLHYLKMDFNKWCDEDDDLLDPDDNSATDLTDLLKAMGSNKADGGDNKPSFDDLESDSDDDNLPDLDCNQ